MQNQISFLCNQCPDVEWSGTLFYTSKGEIGDDDFELTAESVFLQDIGTGTYTEYEPGNPEYIKFMMGNPDARKMKQGHIHSHNKMGVFFSGTDSDELRENSPFHNYYLSLIVNNKNDMTAKLAFVATVKQVINSEIIYNDGAGKPRSYKTDSQNEEKYVYCYDCVITKPVLEWEAGITSRFSELLQQKEEKAKEAAKKAQTINKNLAGNRAFEGFNVTDRWEKEMRQTALDWDELPEKGSYNQKDIDAALLKIEKRENRKTDKRVYTFVAKLVDQDMLYEGTLSDAIEAIRDLYFPANETPAEESINKQSYEYYLDSIEKSVFIYYANTYPEDPEYICFNDILDDAIDIMDHFKGDYFVISQDISQALELQLKEAETWKR